MNLFNHRLFTFHFFAALFAAFFVSYWSLCIRELLTAPEFAGSVLRVPDDR